ncbi:MAG: helix-turn-helix transcriptional regulator [Chloroflexi bacterium]|nr:helix-turn-helix transcriptional regulator [Chloroflexota bacterium]
MTRRRQAEERRAQLIDTALSVFAQKGVDGATVKELSEEAGVAQGLLYHYFRSKEDLLRAALERHYFLPELRRITAPDRDRPAQAVLIEVAEGFAAMLREHRPLMQVMIREAPTNPAVAERVERAQRESVRLLSEYLESRVVASELRPHDTQATARLLLFAVLMGHLTDTLDQSFLTAVIETILHGVASA